METIAVAPDLLGLVLRVWTRRYGAQCIQETQSIRSTREAPREAFCEDVVAAADPRQVVYWEGPAEWISRLQSVRLPVRVKEHKADAIWDPTGGPRAHGACEATLAGRQAAVSLMAALSEPVADLFGNSLESVWHQILDTAGLHTAFFSCTNTADGLMLDVWFVDAKKNEVLMLLLNCSVPLEETAFDFNQRSIAAVAPATSKALCLFLVRWLASQEVPSLFLNRPATPPWGGWCELWDYLDPPRAIALAEVKALADMDSGDGSSRGGSSYARYIASLQATEAHRLQELSQC